MGEQNDPRETLAALRYLIESWIRTLEGQGCSEVLLEQMRWTVDEIKRHLDAEEEV